MVLSARNEGSEGSLRRGEPNPDDNATQSPDEIISGSSSFPALALHSSPLSSDVAHNMAEARQRVGTLGQLRGASFALIP